MAEKKVKKIEVEKNKTFLITKSNGRIIQRDNLPKNIIAGYKFKGWKVEEA